MSETLEKIPIIYKIIRPGYLSQTARAVYFFLFLIITIGQTYCSLLMEEDIAREEKYPEHMPKGYV